MSRLERRPDWRTEFPGNDPSRIFAERLSAIRTDLQEGRISKARDALRGTEWMARVDLAGVPETVLARAKRLVDLAWDALREPHVTPDAAEKALQKAVAIFTPGGEAPE